MPLTYLRVKQSLGEGKRNHGLKLLHTHQQFLPIRHVGSFELLYLRSSSTDEDKMCVFVKYVYVTSVNMLKV